MIHHNTQDSLKVALITGGAKRIGAGIAKKLHACGFKVAIHCNHSLVEAQALVEKFNQQRADSACVIQGDLKTSQIASDIISSVENWAGRLDVLINNASIFMRGDAVFNLTQWQDLFTINVQIPFELSLQAYPFLAQNNGSIINITDIHGEKPLKGYAAYCQTKAALVMQTKALAKEFAPLIRVNAVAPGAIAWPEQDNALSEDVRKKIIAKTPLQSHGDPDFIAQAVWALIENSFITGQVLNVDGGRSI